MNAKKNLAILLLAAGSSARMGKPKQALTIQGESLLHRITRLAVESGCGFVTVVVGSHASGSRQLIEDLDVDVVENKNWSNGMGNSLKFGLGHLLGKIPALRAVLVLVCDQPSLSVSHLQKLMQAYHTTGSKAVASVYAGAMGVPALFDQSLFKDLLSLDDSQGARTVLRKLKDQPATVEMPGGEIDLDTPEDYKNFLAGS